MTDIIINFFVQVLLSVGVILIFGSLIAFCNKTFYSNIGHRSNALCIATGFIGTPIHELSHALFCVIFRHKINEIKLNQKVFISSVRVWLICAELSSSLVMIIMVSSPATHPSMLCILSASTPEATAIASPG